MLICLYSVQYLNMPRMYFDMLFHLVLRSKEHVQARGCEGATHVVATPCLLDLSTSMHAYAINDEGDPRNRIAVGDVSIVSE